MSEKMYTLAMWKVKSGRDSEFVEAWKDLNTTFSELPSPPLGGGVLLQSLEEPSVYYSFGPWASTEDIAAMREDPAAQESIHRLIDLCEEAAPGGYRVVAET
ncbi:MAG: hypothetical protein R3272_13095 [Candidatus Promineifilaceae bacterium]|nr:hypothetical protein [Candidatus Promineifilaceae bacterium]